MSDNRSLDEFARREPSSDDQSKPAAGGAERGDEGSAAAETEARTEGTEPAASDVEPMDETFAWSANGGSCGNCGDVVEERWRDGDELVCSGCKPW